MFGAFFLITQCNYLLKWRNMFSIQDYRGAGAFFNLIFSVFVLHLVTVYTCFILKGNRGTTVHSPEL